MENNENNKTGEFHFIGYKLNPKFCTDTYNRTFVTCDTPEQFDNIAKNYYMYKDRERFALVNITEQEYTRLKNDAFTESQKTGHFVNKGFVANFSLEYKNILNPRDTTLE